MKCVGVEEASKSNNPEVTSLFSRRFSVGGISFDHFYLTEGWAISPTTLLPGFNILNWATPEPPRSRYRLIKSIRLEEKEFIFCLRQSSAWSPSLSSYSEVVTDNDGNSFAEVVVTPKSYDIYLLFNLAHTSTDQTGTSIRTVLKALIKRCLESVPVPPQLLNSIIRQILKMHAEVRKEIDILTGECQGDSPELSRKREVLLKRIQIIEKLPDEINLLNALDFVSDIELKESAITFSLLGPGLIRKKKIKVALFLNGRWATSNSRCWGSSYKLFCLLAGGFYLASLAAILNEFYNRNGWDTDDE